MRRASIVLSIVLAAAVALLGNAREAGARELEATFGDSGLESLVWSGENVVKDGRPAVGEVVLEKKWINEAGVNQYEWETLMGKDPRISAAGTAPRVTYSYSWGTVHFQYSLGPDRLGMTVTLENTSHRTIADFDIRPLELRLPDGVEKRKRWNRMVSMPDHVGVVEARYGDEKLLLCSETTGYLKFGLGRPRNGRREMPVLLRGGLHMMSPGGVQYPLLGLPRVKPGESLTVKFSLRFAHAGADTHELVADIYDSFRQHHRPRLVWKDRRPVGAIFLPTGRGPANNPRNWFKDKDLDVRTRAGRAELRAKFMSFADRCIDVLKNTTAQGMVV
mgnify:FL=1